MHPNIVILAGGISSRMKKQSSHNAAIDPSLLREANTKSKAMLGVGGGSRPFLDYLLYNISKAGYKNVVIVVGERDSSIRDYYELKGGKEHFKNLGISYAVQPIPAGRTKPLGTADALLRGLQSIPSWKGQCVTVCNSDNLYSVSALQLMLADDHPNALVDYDRSALQFPQDRIAQFAVIKKDQDGFLQDIIEKPAHHEIEKAADKSGRVGVSMNVFRFSYDMVLPYLETVPLHPQRHEKELPAAVKMMVSDHPRSVYTVPVSEHVIDLTSQSDIPTVKEYLAQAFPEFVV
jgi:glucose-1-phosphate adenylyltransferase